MLSLEFDHIGQVSWDLFAAVIGAGNFAKMSVFGCRVYFFRLNCDHIGWSPWNYLQL